MEGESSERHRIGAPQLRTANMTRHQHYITTVQNPSQRGLYRNPSHQTLETLQEAGGLTFWVY